MNHLISVIIPTWNRSISIKKSIESVLKQSNTNFEVIVCDDGSTDDTRSTVEGLRIPCLKYLALPHTGLPAVARNRGIQAAKGDYVAFLDSDDTWTPDKLELQMQFMQKNKSKLCGTNAYRLGDKSKKNMLANPPTICTYEHLLATNWLIASSVLVDRNLLMKSGLFPETPSYRAYEDWLLWMRLSTFEPFYFLDKPLVIYNDNPAESIRSVQADWQTIIGELQTAIIPWGIKNLYSHPHKRALIKSMYQSYIKANSRRKV